MAVHKVGNGFDDIFTRVGGLEVFHEVEGLLSILVLQVVYDHVESCFWEQLKQRR